MSNISGNPESPEAVALVLMEKLLAADGKGLLIKGHGNAATREEIVDAFKEASRLVHTRP